MAPRLRLWLVFRHQHSPLNPSQSFHGRWKDSEKTKTMLSSSCFETGVAKDFRMVNYCFLNAERIWNWELHNFHPKYFLTPSSNDATASVMQQTQHMLQHEHAPWHDKLSCSSKAEIRTIVRIMSYNYNYPLTPVTAKLKMLHTLLTKGLMDAHCSPWVFHALNAALLSRKRHSSRRQRCNRHCEGLMPRLRAWLQVIMCWNSKPSIMHCSFPCSSEPCDILHSLWI